jgi:hypothetical protein
MTIKLGLTGRSSPPAGFFGDDDLLRYGRLFFRYKIHGEELVPAEHIFLRYIFNQPFELPDVIPLMP